VRILEWFRRGESSEPAEDDSGEDVQETEEELDREADPAGDMPRIKTDGI